MVLRQVVDELSTHTRRMVREYRLDSHYGVRKDLRKWASIGSGSTRAPARHNRCCPHRRNRTNTCGNFEVDANRRGIRCVRAHENCGDVPARTNVERPQSERPGAGGSLHAAAGEPRRKSTLPVLLEVGKTIPSVDCCVRRLGAAGRRLSHGERSQCQCPADQPGALASLGGSGRERCHIVHGNAVAYFAESPADSRFGTATPLVGCVEVRAPPGLWRSDQGARIDAASEPAVNARDCLPTERCRNSRARTTARQTRAPC